ncbi:hypothetical protein LOD99_2922 [Oopsacas minuta]|uniref:Uncharacterized protein n=1 Tax=Oopsacas minuta TaxID=111878 RepID=A0AAV7JZ44_9METZ|nr:hypothetical protein LOD99_2922 [Oopsacas minuta]
MEKRYGINIHILQKEKNRRFFVKGRYILDKKQDLHVYKHRKEIDCYIVYKINRMKASNEGNWKDCESVLSIGRNFDKSEYEYIFGAKISQNKNFENNEGENRFQLNLLQPLWNLGIFDLQDIYDNIDCICTSDCQGSRSMPSLYVENCNKLLSMKQQKYRDVYYRGKEKFSQEDKTNLQEIDLLERTRKTLLEEKRILLVEIGTYHFMMRNNYCPLEP